MRARVLGATLAIWSLAVASPVAAAVNLISNGSFEIGTPNDNSNGFTDLVAGNTSIAGWTIGGDSIDWIGSYWQPGDGKRSIDLSGVGLGSLSQSFKAVIGKQYTVSFLLAGNPDRQDIGPVIKTVDVSVGTAFNQTFNFSVATSSHTNMNWTPESFTFTANSPIETLKFASVTCGKPGEFSCAFGPALDAVSVSAVPELSTWGMMLIGFAAMALFAYRRSKKHSDALSLS